ncbi:MAG: hypothetical protein LBT39_02235 [Treponema sp.]|jgi:hypothetical protein|nr:hypothetical protein [Treponema sp.]
MKITGTNPALNGPGRPPSPQTDGVAGHENGLGRGEPARVGGDFSHSSTRSLASLLSILKLPPGELSVSLVSFAKFFSLPLNAAFLGKIRQQVLAAGKVAGQNDAPAKPAQGREAQGNALPPQHTSLAAMAAVAKGVELNPETLAKYARTLLRGKEQGDRAAEDGDKAANGDAETDGGLLGGKAAKESPAIPEGRYLRERVLAAQGPLTNVLNKLPGKEGKRWVVLPFSTGDGLDVCLRILLTPPNAGGRTGAELDVEYMVMDIRDAESCWTFKLCPLANGTSSAAPPGSSSVAPPGTSAGGQTGEDAPPALQNFSLELARDPALAPARQKALEQELAALLGMDAEQVHIREAGEFLLFAEDKRDWTLRSINKEV